MTMKNLLPLRMTLNNYRPQDVCHFHIRSPSPQQVADRPYPRYGLGHKEDGNSALWEILSLLRFSNLESSIMYKGLVNRKQAQRRVPPCVRYEPVDTFRIWVY